MPAELDRLQKEIWARLKGKTNPRTKKPYTESDAWAIATAQFKKKKMSYSESEFPDEQELMNSAIDTLARGEGQGVGGPRQGDGGTDTCKCPKCGYTTSHQRGTPCAEMKCPKCGSSMGGA